MDNLIVIRSAEELHLLDVLCGADVLALDVETSPREPAKKTITEKRVVQAEPTIEDMWAALGDDPPAPKTTTETVEVEVWDEDQNKVKGLDPWRNRLRMVQLSDGQRVVVILCDGFESGDGPPLRYAALRDHLQPLLDDALVIGANLTFDVKQTQFHIGVRIPHKYDLSIAERMLTAGKYPTDSEWFQGGSLKGILKKYCGVEVEKEIREEFGHNTEITEEQITYGAKDVLYLPSAFAAQWAVVEEEKAEEAAEIEMGAIQGVVEMELHGMPVDQGKWREIADTAEQNRRQVYDELQVLLAPPGYKKLVGDAVKHLKTYNPGSPEETVIAFRRLGVELTVRGDDGKPKPSADEQAIKAALVVVKDEGVKHALKRQLDHAEYKKQATTYGYEWLDKHINPVTGRVHSSYDQYGAKTGRYASSRPNLQNIPVRDHPEYRDAFTLGEGSVRRFIIADFSGCELRCLAYLSQDPVMLEAFNGIPPKDLHVFAASLIFGKDYDSLLHDVSSGDKDAKKLRSISKNLNFGVAYGIGSNKLAEDSGISVGEAKGVLEEWRRVFSVANSFLNAMSYQAWHDGVIYGLAGHRKYFLRPDPTLPREKFTSQKAGIEREGKNWPEQNGNAIMTKLASALIIPRIEPLGGKLCHLVHDETVATAPAETADAVRKIVHETMIEAGEFYLRETPSRRAVKMEVESQISDHWAK